MFKKLSSQSSLVTIIVCFQMQVQILEAFVSALCWINFVLLVLISLYLENGFQSFQVQPPILRGSQEKENPQTSWVKWAKEVNIN